MSNELLTLTLVFSGILGVLISVSLMGWALQYKLSPTHNNIAIESLNARIRSWWGMVALLGSAFVFGEPGVVLLFAMISFAALREFITLTDTKRADHWVLLAGFFVILRLQYWSIWMGWYGFYSIFIPVYVFLLLPTIMAFHGETKNYLSRIAIMQWALMICVFCASHVPALLSLRIPNFEGGDALLIIFLIVIVQLRDLFGYIFDKRIGKTLIAPSLSSLKTVEGLVASIICASITGVALWWITPFSPLQAGLLAALISFMGFSGGLVMSAIKRDHDVRDWGHSIPGHGGFIDRLDSVVFAAPIFFHVVRFFWDIH